MMNLINWSGSAWASNVPSLYARTAMVQLFKKVKRSTRFASETKQTSRSLRKSLLLRERIINRLKQDPKLSRMTIISHNSKIRATENYKKVSTKKGAIIILKPLVMMVQYCLVVKIWSMMKALYNLIRCYTQAIKHTQVSPTMPQTMRAIIYFLLQIGKWPGLASQLMMSKVVWVIMAPRTRPKSYSVHHQ